MSLKDQFHAKAQQLAERARQAAETGQDPAAEPGGPPATTPGRPSEARRDERDFDDRA